MAESVPKLLVACVKKDCSSTVCPYRSGDGDKDRQRLEVKMNKQLEGSKIAALERRVEELKSKVTSLTKQLTQARQANTRR